MTITFEKINKIDDTTFDNLYADSLDDINSGTIVKPDDVITDEQTKQLVHDSCYSTYTVDENRYCVLAKKDDTPFMWIVGTKNNNVFRWETVLNAKIDGSREIFATQEFQNAYAEYLKSVGINTWEILCVKDKRVDTYFIRLQDAGKCLGSYNSDATYTRQTDLDELNNTAALHKWVF